MKRKPYSRRKRTTTKSVLRLPDLEHAKAAVLNSLTSLDAQRGYRHAIDEFVDWYCSEPRLALNRIVVLRYRSHLESRRLAPGTVNLRLGAVRRLAYEAADCGLLSADLAAGIRRVKGVKKLGIRLGNSVNGSNVVLEGSDEKGDTLTFRGTVDNTGTMLTLHYIINGSASRRCEIDNGDGTVGKR